MHKHIGSQVGMYYNYLSNRITYIFHTACGLSICKGKFLLFEDISRPYTANSCKSTHILDHCTTHAKFGDMKLK